MKGAMTIKFIPVGEDDHIEVPTGTGPMGYSETVNHYLGFLPGKRGRREGWLVYGVHVEATKKLHVHKQRRLKAVS